MFDSEKYRDDLVRLGVHKVAHQDHTLMDHMYRACAIQQDMKSTDHICLAALFHGVYGTEGLHSDEVDAIPEARRTELRAVVGPEIERLIFNFSVMSYQSLGKSLRNLMRPSGKPELKDRRTGEDIPLDRREFEDLLRLKLGDVLAHLPEQAAHSQLDLPAEYGGFWRVAAEYLGDDAINTWNSMMGARLWIDTETN